MRAPWLPALFIFLLPIILICLKLSNDFGLIDSSASLSITFILIVVLLGAVAVLFLFRLLDWHPSDRRRQQL